VHIGEVIRNAVLFNPGNHQERLVNSDFLIETVARFFALLRERQVEYVLVGDIAMLQYVEGRNTEDVELIMAVSALERLPELQVETSDENFARGRFNDLKVDVLLTSNSFFEEVGKRYTTLYRQGNFTRVGFTRVGLYENDVATLLHAHHPPIEPLLDKLSLQLNDSDMRQVKQIASEIQQRLSRFEERS
jgi:hypothetical protein